jgi:hypothetical protein
MIVVDKAGNVTDVDDLSVVTQIPYVPHLAFDSFRTLQHVVRKNRQLKKKKLFSTQQMWLGSYFEKEVLEGFLPCLSLRWVSDEIGWGVFAEQDFKATDFIAEYSGIFRRRKKEDSTNAYCFECPFVRGEPSRYLIDAKSQGGISRYINHSDTPNVVSALATVSDLSHIVLCVREPIKKGTELRYDYGAEYWKKRKKCIT